jgi:hypothetical protein
MNRLFQVRLFLITARSSLSCDVLPHSNTLGLFALLFFCDQANDHDSVPGIAVDAVFEYLEKEHTRHESSLLEDDLGEGTSKPAQANKDPSRPPTTKPYVPSPSQNHGSVELMKKFLHQR